MHKKKTNFDLYMEEELKEPRMKLRFEVDHRKKKLVKKLIKERRKKG